ncbi:BadF/BadG/BcrA/BcrD ATPase family protein [Asticcacaulis sp. EMRT-3]|uniref:N-acetylglucosamine kinase n=1 Tax=Asticcacaulis sp. EMRT-3 TaxID=3040349 RepID=UPI0024AFCE0B|nr:BadF/BadG/BcrA/BcrD ATPase family protein [Asticcacaulis sp. EMRT-3]MDI7775752.1 BadF/BadG/BcrA/BcrD ATPase family protein [Asticcacaulis sp. EMRT-3]
MTERTGLYLGVDGGGTKTEFMLIDAEGHVRGRHQGGSSYYLQTGFDGLNHVLGAGVAAVLAAADAQASDIRHAFFGLPAHGEDSQTQPLLDVMPEAVLGHRRYLCGNDMICGWAGSLAGGDGINIVAGTGSIAYGERHGLKARCGGWGEVFSDEGSAYWIAIQGLNAFARMSDGRLPKGILYAILKAHYGLSADLDLCGRVMGDGPLPRDQMAALSQFVAQAARDGDAEALRIFGRAADELAAMIEAIRQALDYPLGEAVRVSYSGGVFNSEDLILAPLKRALAAFSDQYDLTPPLLSPGLGAALYAARLAGEPLAPDALDRLQSLV